MKTSPMAIERFGAARAARQAGFTLMELMMALAIGMVVMVGLITAFVNSSKAQRAAQQAGEQIENGRMAMDFISQDLKMAGYYNTYYLLPSSGGVPQTPTNLPDPCLTSPLAGSTSSDNLTSAMSVHVQVYNAPAPSSGSGPKQKPDLSAAGGGTSCGGLLGASNLVAGSDVLVVRRASTKKVLVPSDVKANYVYLQTGAFAAALETGVSGLSTLANMRADGTAPAPQLQQRDAGGNLVAGELYRYVVDIYFVAPCSSGSGTGGVCQSGDDALPTLKRLELRGGAAAPVFTLTPLVEGIQAIAFDSGVDNAPNVVSPATGFIGDGQPDVFKRDGYAGQTLSLADRANTVAMNVFVLARNTLPQADVNDQKTYVLTDNAATGAGSLMTYGPYGDQYRRHVYQARVSIENWMQRRENP